MKKFFAFVSGIIIFMNGSIVNVSSSKIQANIVDFDIDFVNMEKKVEKPILIYNDYTYISLRDVAEIFKKEIKIVNKNNKCIQLIPKKHDKIINNSETAIEIAKSILKDNFKDKINDNTKYNVYFEESDHLGAQGKYFIEVIFNATTDSKISQKNFKKLKDITI